MLLWVFWRLKNENLSTSPWVMRVKGLFYSEMVRLLLHFIFPFLFLPFPPFSPSFQQSDGSSESQATNQPGSLKLMTSHVLQTSCRNQSMAGWQIVPSMYSDKQISAKMLLTAYQMCWALWYGTADEKLSTSHLCFCRDHRCSNLCWTK